MSFNCHKIISWFSRENCILILSDTAAFRHLTPGSPAFGAVTSRDAPAVRLLRDLHTTRVVYQNVDDFMAGIFESRDSKWILSIWEGWARGASGRKGSGRRRGGGGRWRGREKGPSDFSMACRRFHTLSGAVSLSEDTLTHPGPGRGPRLSHEVGRTPRSGRLNKRWDSHRVLFAALFRFFCHSSAAASVTDRGSCTLRRCCA